MPDNILPRYLYKYGSFDKPERFEDVLLNSQVWFANRAGLNDPFELRPAASADFGSPGFREQFFKRLHKILRTKGLNNYRQREVAIQRHYSDLLSKQFSIRDRYHDFLATLGIYCLSENPDSLLMWAHYTEGHTGYRLKFDTQNWREGFAHAAKVVYQAVYPEIDVWSLVTDYAESEKLPAPEVVKAADTSAVLTKSNEWSYEAEWRIMANAPQYIKFNPNSLVQVALGCNASDQCVESVRALTRKSPSPISLVKMSLDEKEYRLKEIQLP